MLNTVLSLSALQLGAVIPIRIPLSRIKATLEMAKNRSRRLNRAFWFKAEYQLAAAGELTDEAVHVWAGDLTPDVAAQAVDALR